MNYWKGLMIAAAIDLVWIMGSPTLAPDTTLTTDSLQVSWPMSPERADIMPIEPEASEVERLDGVGRQVDSLMMYLRAHPEDIDALEQIAAVYANNGWWNDAIGPLARAIQLDPSRRTLWSALDRAVDNAGLATITDAELTERAAAFAEAIEMYGDGC